MKIKRIVIFILFIYIISGRCVLAADFKSESEIKSSGNLEYPYTKTIKVGEKATIDGIVLLSEIYVVGGAGLLEVQSQEGLSDDKGAVKITTNFQRIPGLCNGGEAKIFALKPGECRIYAVHGDYHLWTLTIEPAPADPGTSVTPPTSNVDVLDNIGYYQPDSIDSASANRTEKVIGKVLGIISNIGIVVSVIILAILGIKYMLGSLEEKAEYKQDLIPYVIGACTLFGITSITKIILALGTTINNM